MKPSKRRLGKLAMLSSRRGVLSLLGRLAVGAAIAPLLPIDRTFGKPSTDPHQMDPAKCDYWKILRHGWTALLVLVAGRDRSVRQARRYRR